MEQLRLFCHLPRTGEVFGFVGPWSKLPSEAVGRPLFRADAVVHEEEPVRIVLLFDLRQTPVVIAPVGTLEIRVDEVALGDIGAVASGDHPKFSRGAADVFGRLATQFHGGLVVRNAGIRGSLVWRLQSSTSTCILRQSS